MFFHLKIVTSSSFIFVKSLQKIDNSHIKSLSIQESIFKKVDFQLQLGHNIEIKSQIFISIFKFLNISIFLFHSQKNLFNSFILII